MRNLDEIRAAYERGDGSLRKLAERFSVPLDTLKKRCGAEKWHRPTSVGATSGTKTGTMNGTGAISQRKMAPKNGTNSVANGAAVPKIGTKSLKNGTNQNGTTIPGNINSLSKLEAARFYHSALNFAVHALVPPDRGDENERGKKPISKGWRSHVAAEVTPEYLDRHFGPGSNYNLGAVVRPPYVHIDLDSKPDAGTSVRIWLAAQAHLSTVPREQTGGGAHLLFICRDLPESVAAAKKALTVSITDAVQAELYTDGMNIVLSPSIHKSGHRYFWEVTGAIPAVSWDDLAKWFGFEAPESAKRGRPKKEKPWWADFKGNLYTLDAVALFKEVGILGDCLDPDDGKWALTCPWEKDHTGGGPKGTATVIFQKDDSESIPAFKCLHSHCVERTIKDVLLAIESEKPGLVDRHCRDRRVFQKGGVNTEGLPQVVLPGLGRPDSKFAIDMGDIIGPREVWFNKGEELVWVGLREFSETVKQIAFNEIEPVRVCTEVEIYSETGILERDKDTGDKIFVPVSMSRETAAKMIAAPQFIERIPRIIRILDVAIPVRTSEGDIVFPKRGYDPVLRTWLPHDAPAIHPMPVDQAREVIRDIYSEFCWANQMSVVNAIARLITPYCKGLFQWNARTPLWVFQANQPGAGKDYCADVAHMAYTGNRVGDAPLGRDGEEIRKRITTFLNSGRRFIHLANCQIHIEDQTFIGLLTSTTFNARNLGSTNASSDLNLANEAEFSISANTGLTFRDDLSRRMRRIDLFLAKENQNSQSFKRTDLLGWINRNRSLVLSAVASLVHQWIKAGMPPGPSPFASFPEWAATVGGVMHHSALGDPCLPDPQDVLAVGGDRMTRAMTALYQLAFKNYPSSWVETEDIYKLIAATDSEDLTWFGSFGMEEARSTKTKIGMHLRKFKGRELAGITLEIDASGSKSIRHMLRFSDSAENAVPAQLHLDAVFFPTENAASTPSKAGHPGHLGHLHQQQKVSENKFDKKKRERVNIICSKPQTADGGVQGVQGIQVASGAIFPEIAAAITAAGSVALDIETFGPRKSDGLNPWRGDIRLLSLKVPDGSPWLIDLQSTGYDLGELGCAIEAVEVIAHNAKFDLLWLAVKCAVRPKKVFCTLTAARLLSAGTKPGNNLDQCLERFLGIAPAPDQSRSDWGGMFLTDDQLAYAARDVAHLHVLAGRLDAELGGADLETVRTLEMELLPAIVAMEVAGIAMDKPRLQAIRDSSRETTKAKADELRILLNAPSLNPGSPDQLKAALSRAGIEVANTNEETLKAADDGTIIPAILELRGAEKSAQQAESLIDCIEGDGRIHGRFEPTGTDTGRFSSKTPNLQNIGRGELRECFLAPTGSRLIVADYSQIELRAAAAIAGEAKMIEAYRRGDDLHKLTAATVLGKPIEEVTKADRQTGKSASFGLLYGQSAKGLVRYAASSYGVTLEEDEAEEIRRVFFRTYGALRQWHGESHNIAERGVGEVRTVLGRRRLIPKDADAWQQFTALVNTPVQGGCADGMKRALVLIASRLPANSRLISTVHDEVIVESPEADAEVVCAVVRESMISAMTDLFPQVPIEVEAGVCERWSEK